MILNLLMASKRKLNFDNLPSPKHNKLDDTSSAEDKLSSGDCIKYEKELLDYVLDKYRDAVFELFNIIITKLDRIHQQHGFGEEIIKESLQELNKCIEDRKQKREIR